MEDMTDSNEKMELLLGKLETLLKRQESFSREINDLRDEIKRISSSQFKTHFDEKKEARTDLTIHENVIEAVKETAPPTNPSEQEKIYKKQNQYKAPKHIISPQIKSDIEKFIGENLINKIGIAITVIGVAIGAKYSIEHQLISPLTRIILGYLMGLGLLGFGIKLKNKYANYSAVLVSGAIAILYFITYSAYSFYDLIPQLMAFTLMLVFTAFAVVAAINYDKQIIALFGLVGAYAVPFLLSEGSGSVSILFSYMAIINIGILFIAFKKYWKLLYYSSFLVTWLIYFLWYAINYQVTEHFQLSLGFLFVFFLTFYSIFLAYKLVHKEKFVKRDIILLLANSFVFYGLGFSILSTHKTGEQLLGLFTLFNAIVHFAVSAVIYRQKLGDRNLFFLVAGLVLVFITIAIPVQLDGNWVTLLWVFEAASLFWIGRTKIVPFYEKLSYPLMYLAFFSITQDWGTSYNNYNPDYPDSRLTPILNINFLSSVLFMASFIFINYLNNNKKYDSPLLPQKGISSLINISMPAILLIVLYYSFQMEISNYWNQLFVDSAIGIKKEGQEYPDNFWNFDLNNFQTIWIFNYSLFFFTILSYVNIKKFKNRNLGLTNIGLSIFVLLFFLTQGLFILSELRETYLNQTLSEYYHRSSFNIGIRYISFALVGLLLFSIYKYLNQDFLKPVFKNVKMGFDLLLYTSILWIASSELISWMDIMKSSQSYKLGLSILWGVFALLLIVLGIWKKKKHIRIGAIALFTVTLIKLFFYDISDLDTIAKTIVFVSLGILLLLISFLYNKYKHLISEEIEN
jgi:uncharacterized membrane protein